MLSHPEDILTSSQKIRGSEHSANKNIDYGDFYVNM
jgi:hypothetical protein